MTNPRSIEAAQSGYDAALTAAYQAIDAAPPAGAEISAAIALLEANGYRVRRSRTRRQIASFAITTTATES